VVEGTRLVVGWVGMTGVVNSTDVVGDTVVGDVLSGTLFDSGGNELGESVEVEDVDVISTAVVSDAGEVVDDDGTTVVEVVVEVVGGMSHGPR
jgi:hypothetical protein